jgi:hypothetical protein
MKQECDRADVDLWFERLTVVLAAITAAEELEQHKKLCEC